MENSFLPAIVVVAFNRKDALNRLLHSLAQSTCPDNTPLVISIDHDADNGDVLDAARNFSWPFGPKEVIYQEKNLGLKKHIIQCGDLVNTYGSVIILEDDLFVSPYFYSYARDALNYYDQDPKISGVSLFNYPRIEKKEDPLPFYPVEDHSDVYFLQYAASSGQAWTRRQWNEFREWFDNKSSLKAYHGMVPQNVMEWPMSSWKKFFITYMVEQDKYFVYPTLSLSTNFDDQGSNRFKGTNEVQARLKIDDRPFLHKPLSESYNIYDSFFELLPDTLNLFNRDLAAYDYEVDLYGMKKDYEISKPYILTTKPCKKAAMRFGRKLKPHEMNVFFNVPGDEIALCRKEDLAGFSRENDPGMYVSDFSYFYRHPLSRRDLMKFLKHAFRKKLPNN